MRGLVQLCRAIVKKGIVEKPMAPAGTPLVLFLLLLEDECRSESCVSLLPALAEECVVDK